MTNLVQETIYLTREVLFTLNFFVISFVSKEIQGEKWSTCSITHKNGLKKIKIGDNTKERYKKETS